MNPDHEAPTSIKPTGRPIVFLQDACYHHKYIRSKDITNIVERPERIRAVRIGLSAAIARLESVAPTVSTVSSVPAESKEGAENLNDLAAALSHMNIAPDAPHSDRTSPVTVVRSTTSVDLLHDPAVKYIHGGNAYLENLTRWTRESWDKIRDEGSEIPSGLAQGDLYLCPESITAMEGAVGAVCEAVDKVIASTWNIGGSVGDTNKVDSRPEPTSSDPPTNRAFVAIRPPGHHCGTDTPSGFCFVNNVAIGAAHAHIQHGIKRVVILDIDLHHGNGTQSITWEINESYGQELDINIGAGYPTITKSDLRIYYGSVHDILSYPCEDGKLELVQAASVSLHQAHNQYIENVHLQTYNSEEHFWDVLYKQQYCKILQKAEDFINDTGGPGDDVLVFISCGMDACEHEHESMSRHNRKVPANFYYRFTRDACKLSDRYARGRIISVLEGGYSDRALITGTMAHLCGLAHDAQPVDEAWWNLDNLIKIEKATKKRRGGRSSLGTSEAPEIWVDRAVKLFQTLDVSMKPPSSLPVPPSSMMLRERRSKSASPKPSRTSQHRPLDNQPQVDKKNKIRKELAHPSLPTGKDSSSEEAARPPKVPKPLPRVILRLGPNPSVSPTLVGPSGDDERS